MENLISNEDIRENGRKARSSQQEIVNNCGEIIDYFEGLLHDYCDLPWTGDITEKYGKKHVRVGPNGEEKHYVFSIDSSLLMEYENGKDIWIDLSFDQFNSKNKERGLVEISYGSKENLDKIQILKPDNNKRKVRYSLPREIYGFDID